MSNIEELQSTWQAYLASVIDADIEAFAAFHSEEAYISHMGQGVIEPGRDNRMTTIGAVFDASKSARGVGDPDALQERQTEIDVLSDDLALVQFSCWLRDTSVRYGISALFKREGDGWKIVHSHDSTAAE